MTGQDGDGSGMDGCFFEFGIVHRRQDINSKSVNSLTQTVNMMLILHGGDTTTTTNYLPGAYDFLIINK